LKVGAFGNKNGVREKWMISLSLKEEGEEEGVRIISHIVRKKLD